MFLAVRPPPEVTELIARLPRPHAGGLRFTPPEQWHVTLRFLGACDPEELLAALAGQHLGACRAELGPGVTTLGSHVVMVPVRGLEDLAASVRRITADLGRAPEHRFRGHLTLARAKGRPAGPPIGEAVDASWEPREVEVVSSVVGANGAQHRVIASVAIG